MGHQHLLWKILVIFHANEKSKEVSKCVVDLLSSSWLRFYLFSQKVFYSPTGQFKHLARFKLSSTEVLKVAFQIVGQKFYKNNKKSSLYSQSLLIFIKKTPVDESHPTTREIRELLWPRSTLTGITVYFYISSILIYILQIHRWKFQT